MALVYRTSGKGEVAQVPQAAVKYQSLLGYTPAELSDLTISLGTPEDVLTTGGTLVGHTRTRMYSQPEALAPGDHINYVQEY
jgi:hypothetical protein